MWFGQKDSFKIIPNFLSQYVIVPNEVYIWSGPSMKYGRLQPIHHFPTLVYTGFVEKMMSYVMLLNERLWHFFTKKPPQKFMVLN